MQVVVQGVLEMAKSGGAMELQLAPVAKATAAGLAKGGVAAKVGTGAVVAAGVTGTAAKTIAAKPLLATSGFGVTLGGVTLGAVGTVFLLAGVAAASFVACELGHRRGWFGGRKETPEDEDAGFYVAK